MENNKDLFIPEDLEKELNDSLQKEKTEVEVKDLLLQNLIHLTKMRNKLGKNINFKKEADKRLKKLIGEYKDESDLKNKLLAKDSEIRKTLETGLEELQTAYQLYMLGKDGNAKESTIDARLKRELKEVKKVLKVK